MKGKDKIFFLILKLFYVNRLLTIRKINIFKGTQSIVTVIFNKLMCLGQSFIPDLYMCNHIRLNSLKLPITVYRIRCRVFMNEHTFNNHTDEHYYRVIHILCAATDGCRSRHCLACPPLHAALNCRCS